MFAPVHRCLAVWLVATLGTAALVGWLLLVALTPATRSSTPSSAPTPVTSSRTSVSSEAIRRLARVTCWYSARLRSASSASRSAA